MIVKVLSSPSRVMRSSYQRWGVTRDLMIRRPPLTHSLSLIFSKVVFVLGFQILTRHH